MPIQCVRAIAGAALFFLAVLASTVFPQTPLGAQQQREPEPPRKDVFDIAVLIENQILPDVELPPDATEEEIKASEAAKAIHAATNADMDLLFETLDRQMFFEHVIRLKRPTIAVICDVFGCPDSLDDNPFPPLIWQLTREKQSRLMVYYVGDGQAEGLERQLLFHRADNAAVHDTVAYPVEWLHRMLDRAKPDYAVLMLDTSFAPGPLPCANENPELISDDLVRVRRNYLRISREHWNRTNNLELSATTPVQPPHCDRFDQVLHKIKQPMFTKFFLKGVVDGEADSDNDDMIELGELANYLNDRIKRAARFQWGRSQNVRVVGQLSERLASVRKRKLQEWNDETLQRSKEKENEEEESGKEAEKKGDESTDEIFIHPCVQDEDGQACRDYCRDNADDFHCSAGDDLISKTGGADVNDGPIHDDIEIVTIESGNKAQPDGPSEICRLTAETVSSSLSELIELLPAENTRQTVCALARDELEIELEGWLKYLNYARYVVQPIAWSLASPLVMPHVKNSTRCALDCDGITMAASPPPRVGPTPITANLGLIRRDPESSRFDDFKRFICDAYYKETPFQVEQHRALPFYIGLPRWMPGTRMISDALRDWINCPTLQPLPVPALPELQFVAIEPLTKPLKDCPSGTVPKIRLNRLLADWPSYDTAADLEISGIYLRDLDFGDVDPSLPVEEVCVPEEKEPVDHLVEDQDETPIKLSTSQIRWLQSALTVDNRNPGPIDGAIGDKTQMAIDSWRQDHAIKNEGKVRKGPITEREFQMIIGDFGMRFDQVFDRASPLLEIDDGA